MKNTDNFFVDFIALSVMAGIEKSFSEKKKAEKSQTEKDTAEKKCECKNQSNCMEKCYTKDMKSEILQEIEKCKEIFRDIELFSVKKLERISFHISNIEKKLLDT